MACSFTEDFRIDLPELNSLAHQFSESEFNQTHGLIVEIAAIHVGLTANFNHYAEKELAKAVDSWVTPYPKPVILNHDPLSEAMGRIIGAKMDEEANGTPFIKLQAAITDPKAIEKIKDKRFLTGSVGGKAEESICSICGTDWGSFEGRGLPCVHKKGSVYKGELATREMRDIKFNEYSFVNIPADSNSSILGIGKEMEEDEGWKRAPRFFVLGLEKEEISEFVNIGESVDLLEAVPKKQATSLYLNLKGGFLSALALGENEVEKSDIDNTIKEESIAEENVMTETAQDNVTEETENDNDILSVTETLSGDLISVATQEAEEDKDSEPEEDQEEEKEEQKEEAEEGERPEGQEKPKDKDVDPEDSSGAPISRESEEEESEEESSEEVSTDTPEDKVDPEEAEHTEEESEVPLVDQDDKVKELEAKIQDLEETNTRLKKALHQTLAERVVDAKITAGILKVDERVEAITEHSERTASSLADALRDLSKMTINLKIENQTLSEQLEMERKSEVVETEESVITIGAEEALQENVKEPIAVLEDTLVNVLLGKTNLH